MGKLERRPREWNDEAPIRVEVTRDIDATAAEVFAVLADHETWPEWFDALAKVEVTGAPSGVGAERRVHVKGAGPIDEVFYAWEDGREFGFSLVRARGPLLHAGNELITIADRQGGGVTVTYLQAFELNRWLAPLGRVIRGRFQKGLEDGLDGLTARVER